MKPADSRPKVDSIANAARLSSKPPRPTTPAAATKPPDPDAASLRKAAERMAQRFREDPNYEVPY